MTTVPDHEVLPKTEPERSLFYHDRIQLLNKVIELINASEWEQANTLLQGDYDVMKQALGERHYKSSHGGRLAPFNLFHFIFSLIGLPAQVQLEAEHEGKTSDLFGDIKKHPITYAYNMYFTGGLSIVRYYLEMFQRNIIHKRED